MAQALLAEADVLLLDEAWTGLDRAARAVLDEAAVEQAARGATVLFVDHDPGRLAGRTTAGYLVGEDGALRSSPVSGAGVPGRAGPLVEIEVDAPDGPLPARLPGDPDRTPLAGTVVRLVVPAPYSDALLRALLAGAPKLRVLGLRRLEERVPAPTGADVPGSGGAS